MYSYLHTGDRETYMKYANLTETEKEEARETLEENKNDSEGMVENDHVFCVVGVHI